MLSLQLKSGDYVTIGKDIVIQVFTTSTIQMSVQAPRDMTILRGEVWERNGEERPQCLYDPDFEKSKEKEKTPQGFHPVDEPVEILSRTGTVERCAHGGIPDGTSPRAG